MTKQQKILAAVLALGAGAVIVDQAVVGGGVSGPGAATAQSASSDGDVSPSIARAARATAGLGLVDLDAGPTLADQLHALADAQLAQPTPHQDAFAPGPGWVAPAQVEQAEQADPAGDAVDAFTRGRRLHAVMATGDAGVVNVSGVVLRVGQQLDGLTLERVDRKQAVFVHDSGREIVLSLD